jgi:site-specific recombinase XerC
MWTGLLQPQRHLLVSINLAVAAPVSAWQACAAAQLQDLTRKVIGQGMQGRGLDTTCRAPPCPRAGRDRWGVW